MEHLRLKKNHHRYFGGLGKEDPKKMYSIDFYLLFLAGLKFDIFLFHLPNKDENNENNSSKVKDFLIDSIFFSS